MRQEFHGGSSGGGSINIFANIVKARGIVTATGGRYNGTATNGRGGDGSVTINELRPYLNYNVKEVDIEENEIYKIDNTKIEYLNQNGVQSPTLAKGELIFESLDNGVATVDNVGNITGVSVGETKIKITDTENNISTYIYINVYNGAKVDVKMGDGFTIALKQDGTVWSYGLNDKGQLGLGNNDNKNEPTKVTGLENIKAIEVGYAHTLALTKSRRSVCLWKWSIWEIRKCRYYRCKCSD